MRITVLTPLHFISGEAQLGEQRLSDFLGNLLQSTLKLTDVTVGRLSEPKEPIARHAEVMIPGRDIIFGFEQEPRPARAGGATIVQKHPHTVFLASFPVEIEGQVHALSPTELDMKAMLTTLADRFIPVTQATVTVCSTPRYSLQLPAVMVNARRLSYMATIGGPRQQT